MKKIEITTLFEGRSALFHVDGNPPVGPFRLSLDNVGPVVRHPKKGHATLNDEPLPPGIKIYRDTQHILTTK